MNTPLISIVMGSSSDKAALQGAIDLLDEFEIGYELQVQSAHRTPEAMMEYAKAALTRGVKIIIAAAGGAAHLPGMIASLTTLPVIGVPVPLKNLSGLDSLLSIAQMPAGVPVATVGIANSKNAALLALRILATHDSKIEEKLVRFKANQKDLAQKQNQELS
ncbi:MAG: 5-(carboxyamino)imidazole ribonucleotide mutase [Actinomycetota bacterium]